MLIVPFLLLAAIVVAISRVSLVRWLVAYALGLALLVAGNLTRILLIAWATFAFGQAGYDVTHLIAGTVIVLLTSVTAIVLTFWILGRTPMGRKRERRGSAA